MCYCRYLHHLCCEAGEFHLLSLKMKHQLGLYYIQQNCHEKKSARKIGMYPYEGRSLDVVHDFEFDEESVYFIINIILAMFFLSKKKLMTPNSRKAIFYSLLTENNNLKQETIFVLFANCDH